MTDPYADLILLGDAECTLSVVWIKGGDARISIDGDQPLDQPPPSVRLSRTAMRSLQQHLIAELSRESEVPS
jgi:hypothetical protein